MRGFNILLIEDDTVVYHDLSTYRFTLFLHNSFFKAPQKTSKGHISSRENTGEKCDCFKGKTREPLLTLGLSDSALWGPEAEGSSPSPATKTKPLEALKTQGSSVFIFWQPDREMVKYDKIPSRCQVVWLC